jgi:hypothetical protein
MKVATRTKRRTAISTAWKPTEEGYALARSHRDKRVRAAIVDVRSAFALALPRPMHYVLDGKEPRAVDDLLEWAGWFESANRRVARTEIGDAEVSTVFIGLDHCFGFKGPPILFETMVFADGHPLDEIQLRYSTWAEAETGHIEVCEQLQALDEQSLQAMIAVMQAIKPRRE